ncbi:MAG: transposase [Deltaproteobacteria bacterium]|nr:transposase [Deltaproteobacteria bacterium]
MEQQTIGGITASSLTFEGLEPHFRGKIREWMQALLVEEVTEFLGRGKSERKPVAERKGYRNGYGKGRHLTTAMGTVEVRRPRVRGVEEKFVSRLLPLFVRRTREVRDLLPALYLHGLSEVHTAQSSAEGGTFDLFHVPLRGGGWKTAERGSVRLQHRVHDPVSGVVSV